MLGAQTMKDWDRGAGDDTGSSAESAGSDEEELSDEDDE